MAKYIYVRDEFVQPRHLRMDQHYSSRRGFPVGCFAYDYSPVRKDKEIVGYNIKFGYSIFNPKDKFSKHAARVVAEYRLIMDNALFLSTSNNINKALSELMYYISNCRIGHWNGNDGNLLHLPLRFTQACANMSVYLDSVSKKSNNKKAA